MEQQMIFKSDYCPIRTIPCACIECRNSMDLPWYPYLVPKDQPRYSSVTNLKYYPIWGEYNDWVIMDFIDKGTYEEDH